MKHTLLIRTALTSALAILITGCNAANFSASKAGSEKIKGLEADGSSTAASVSANDPGIPASCNTQLKQKGLKYSGGIWRKRVNVPCGYSGIGYVEGDVEIDAVADQTCDRLAELDGRLAGGAPEAGYQQPLRNEPPTNYGTHTAATAAGPFKWIERSRHCAQSTRCQATQTPSNVLGRMAWLKKCEAGVPEFKAFLDGLRRVEDCNSGNIQNDGQKDPRAFAQSKICVFANGGVAYFPIVKLNGSQDDNAPAPSLTAANHLSKIDDLAALAAQVTDACPAPTAVAPIDTVCTAGCYAGDQRLLTSAEGKYEAILTAKTKGIESLAVLSRASTIEAPRFVNVKVARYTASLEDAKEILLTFETASGAKLVLTTNHPLLDGEGVMREASSFKAGQTLVKADGARTEIVSITRQEFFGKVYNVSPVSIAPEDNLVVSEGLINGSHNFQTVLRSELNRQVLRDNLAKGI